MSKFHTLALAGLALIAGAAPALAARYDAEKALCAAAIAAEAGLDASVHSATLDKFREGGVKRATVTLRSQADGSSVTGVCKIRRGEVTEIEIA